MKRILALLLAMLLPVCVLAETQQLVVSVDMADGMQAKIQQALLAAGLPDVDEDDSQIYAQLIESLLNGLRITVTMQDNAFAIEVCQSVEKLLDLITYSINGNVYLTSTMLPGYALQFAASKDGNAIASKAFDGFDWKSVRNDIRSTVTAWVSSLDKVEDTGAFVGDAYKGGTHCTTWYVSDADIATLLSNLVNGKLREWIAVVLEDSGLDGKSMLSDIDALNNDVAEADRYMYVIRAVRDDSDKLIGLSATVLDGTYQIGTLSLGLQDNDVKIVMGLGLTEQNYWCSAELMPSASSIGTAWTCRTKEWLVDKEQGFSYASTANAAVASHCWQLTKAESGDSITREWTAYQGEDFNIERRIFAAVVEAFKGKADIGLRFATCSGTQEELTLRISCESADRIHDFDQSLKICSMTSLADEALYTDLMNTFSATLSARLLKVLPMDLIMDLYRLSIP